MSGMYNMVCGVDPLAPYILAAIGLKPDEIPRLRDAFMHLNVEKREYELAILTRTGGDNRASYRDEIEALRKVEGFLRDEDYHALDDTYAIFLYTIPDRAKPLFTEVIKQDKVTPEPSERFKRAINALDDLGDTSPEAERARKAAKEIGDQIRAAMG